MLLFIGLSLRFEVYARVEDPLCTNSPFHHLETKAPRTMSDDEEEIGSGRNKRSALVKKGRNRIRTLADSSDDDDLFNADSSDDDDDKDEEQPAGPDVSFSSDRLKEAMVRGKLVFRTRIYVGPFNHLFFLVNRDSYKAA